MLCPQDAQSITICASHDLKTEQVGDQEHINAKTLTRC